jgi:hypothetical protein
MRRPTTSLSAAFGLAILGMTFSSVAVRAEESGGQNACFQDALSICGQFIPDRERVASCLLSNRGRVSPACRSALTHFNPRSASAN